MKGAPEHILQRCSSVMEKGAEKPLDEATKEAFWSWAGWASACWASATCASSGTGT